MTTDIIEKKISAIEKFQKKMAKDQMGLYEALGEFSGDLMEDIAERVSTEVSAKSMEINQKIDTKTAKLESRIEKTEEKTKLIPIDRELRGKLTKTKQSRMYQITGNGTPEYELFYSRFADYSGGELKVILNGLSSVEDISVDEYNSAILFLKGWTPTEFHYRKAIKFWRSQEALGKLKGNKSYILELLKKFLSKNKQYT